MSDTPSAAKLARLMYLHGKIEGIRKYAHWGQGREMVGTCGTTYEYAVKPYKEEGAALMNELGISSDELARLAGAE